MMLTSATVDVSLLALSPWDIALRMLLAMLIGAVVGGEREMTHRPAGMRTHMLVSLGACAVMVTSQMIFAQYREFGATPDPARLSAQVITGVGFLGAGTILREGNSIKGLTTAASVWAVACLGVAVGGGYYMVGIFGMICMMITLVVFEFVQNKLMRGRNDRYFIKAVGKDVAGLMHLINELAVIADAKVTSIEVEDGKDGSFSIDFAANFTGRHSNDRMTQFMADLSSSELTDSASCDRSRV